MASTHRMVRRRINTIDGVATYVKTELEDSVGRWNDSYQTRSGEYVIHRGKEHDVYRAHKGRSR